MKYSRCKCGALQVWHSDESTDMATCSPCNNCGTVPGYGPNDHPPVHEWVEAKVTTDEGWKILTVCRMCYRSKAEIEKALEGEGTK